MDEEQSYLPQKDEEPMFQYIIEQTNHKKIQQHSLSQQNIIYPYTHQIFGLQSPSPFQKQIIVDVKEQSEEDKEIYVKQQNFIQYNGIYEINFKDSHQLESQQENGFKYGRKNKKYKQGRNTEKGLKKLSKQVYQIILELKSATYKEIATQLLQIFHKNKKIERIDYRVEQNIKRRVYDALNVLIAAGLLRKKGKKVIYESKVKNQQKTQVDSVYSEQNKFDMLIMEKQKSYKMKQQRYKCIKNIYQTMQKLIQRNQLKNQDKKIFFPLIGINYNNQETKPFIMKNIKDQLFIKVKKLNCLRADLDFVNQLNLISKNQQVTLKNEEDNKKKTKPKFIYRFQ